VGEPRGERRTPETEGGGVRRGRKERVRVSVWVGVVVVRGVRRRVRDWRMVMVLCGFVIGL
jgi:hypothetical protein